MIKDVIIHRLGMLLPEKASPSMCPIKPEFV